MPFAKITFRKYISLLFLLGIALIYTSCTSDKKEVPVIPCQGTLPDTVSFKKDIIPLLHANCSTVGCHSGSTPQKDLNLEDSVAYIQLNKPGKGYVNTSNPESSVLYIMMNSTTSPMPPTGRLDACKVELVLQWIKQGAKDN